MAKLIGLGYDNNVNADKIVAIVSSSAAPSKELLKS